MNKYFVIALHFDNTKNKQCHYIAGEFTTYINAKLFSEAYEAHYKADTKIIDDFVLLNTNIMEV